MLIARINTYWLNYPLFLLKHWVRHLYPRKTHLYTISTFVGHKRLWDSTNMLCIHNKKYARYVTIWKFELWHASYLHSISYNFQKYIVKNHLKNEYVDMSIIEINMEIFPSVHRFAFSVTVSGWFTINLHEPLIREETYLLCLL